MPYDWPGEYWVKFDDVDVARFKGIGKFVGKTGAAPISALSVTGPGTLEIHRLETTGAAGRLLLDQWRRSSTATTGPARTFTIQALDTSLTPVAQWTIRNARPMKWVMTSSPMTDLRTSGDASTAGEVRVETLTIVHEGIVPTRG